MTENDVNPSIDIDPMEKRNEFIEHPSYMFIVNKSDSIVIYHLFHFIQV